MKLFSSIILILILSHFTLDFQQKEIKSNEPEKNSMFDISIRPGSRAAGLNLRTNISPGDLFEFRTCEGIITGNTTLGSLFQVCLPDNPGDGIGSWKKEGDKWNYSWTYSEGIIVYFETQPSEIGQDISYTLTNTGTKIIKDLQLHTCITTTEAPGFFPDSVQSEGKYWYPGLFERLSLWSEGRRYAFSEVPLAATDSHLAFMRKGYLPVHWSWWVNGTETFDIPLISLTSRDGQRTIAMAFENSIWASSNVGDSRACFHLFPWFGSIEPGKSVTVRGKLYFFIGGPKAAYDQFQKDFPGIFFNSLSVRRKGPSTAYITDPSRYRYGRPDIDNTGFYGIPQEKVNRYLYMKWLEESGLLEYSKKPAMGMSGPQNFMPVLAKFVQTGDQVLGQSIILMLKDYHRALKEEVAREGWIWQFIEEAAFVPVYRKYLIEGGLMKPDEAWFRDLWLFYCRNLHVWSNKDIEWRGGCHRSMPEALSKGLASKWYPDIPEAAHWKHYSELVFNDFWRVKDYPQNDTGYFPMTIYMLLCCGEQFLGDFRAVTDPGMQKLWDRLLLEITPDGAINPYGPNGGWNSTAAVRLFFLELAAAKNLRPEYRFGAQKLMNYINYLTPSYASDQYLISRETGQNVALAWLVADDSIAPRVPSQGSEISDRKVALRLIPSDKITASRYLPELDPDPHRARLCCGWVMDNRTVPDKIALRSGWNPGDFFALVELCPTSFPYNPGGILGMNRWGAAFTQVCSSKGHSVENRLLLEDLSGQAPRRLNPDTALHNEDWKKGILEDQVSFVPVFHDTQNSTFAKLVVGNFLGLPVRYEREFIFVKNSYLVSRETVIFEESFPVRAGPVWNTQNIGPQSGPNYANTFMSALVASNSGVSMPSPPVDLLIWFVPRPDCRLKVVDRREEDPRTNDTPYQLLYEWEGHPEKGEKLTWTEVFWPHQPWKSRASTNNPGAKAVYEAGEIAATAGASAIEILKDTQEVTVLRLNFTEGKTNWIVLNPGNTRLDIEELKTDARYAVITQIDGMAATAESYEASYLSFKGNELLIY